MPLRTTIAIVTGGTGGMAPSIGMALARRGVGAVVFAQRGEAAAAVAAVRAAGAASVSLALDVSTRAGVADFFARFAALPLHGGSAEPRLDFLVNVAGACPRTAVDAVDEAEMAATLAVNLTGPFWMCQLARPFMFRAAAAAMREAEEEAAAEREAAGDAAAAGGAAAGDALGPPASAAVVNIGSLAGEDGAFAASIAYTMAKAGLRGMCMQLAKSGFPAEAAAPGAGPRAAYPLIRVNNVSPGPVATEMLASMAPADLAKITAATLTERVTTVAEVAAAVVYLLLDATNMTAQTLQLSGGVIRR